MYRQIELTLKNLNEKNLIQLLFKFPGKLIGTLDILKRSFQVWHTCLSSSQSNFTLYDNKPRFTALLSYCRYAIQY